MEALWEAIPDCIKIPFLLVLAWVILIKWIVGVTSHSSELDEEESTRAAGYILFPAILGLFFVNKAEKELHRAGKYFRVPGAKDEEDIDIL